MVSKNSGVVEETGLILVSEGLATVEQAAKFLAISRAQVYKMLTEGELTSAKLGKSRRIPWTALKELAARSLVG